MSTEIDSLVVGTGMSQVMNWPQTLSRLKADEGFRATPYRCTRGRLTVGYGHNLDARGEIPPKRPLSREQAEALLVEDVKAVVDFVLRRWPWWADLDDARQFVMLSMGFVLGEHGMAAFRPTLKLVQSGDYAGAAKRLRGALWYRQARNRVERLARMLEAGRWPE
ncbi:glycoside hydrolase family protein [Fundidesulfovibrio butyratiphilus]